MKKLIYVLGLIVLLSGCSSIDNVIMKYNVEYPKVKLGDAKEKVLAILLPTQEGLEAKASKQPEAFKQGKDLIEIYYFRSLRQADGLTTDDEFTPYLFTNGILTGIGWTALGGAKSHGQVVQPAPVIMQNQNVTVN